MYLIIFLSSEACYILSGRNATNELGLLQNNERKQKGACEARVTLRQQQASRMGARVNGLSRLLMINSNGKWEQTGDGLCNIFNLDAKQRLYNQFTYIRSFVLLYGLKSNVKIFNFQNKTKFSLGGGKKTYEVSILNNTGTDL